MLLGNASHYFDRVCVISLARREDRLNRFFASVPKAWPFCKIEAIRAVDGKVCRPPTWWKQGGGAWGCYRSHVGIIEDAINRGLKRVLIFEDDATFREDFAERAIAYFEALPSGWTQAYLGGQHLKVPIAIPGNAAVLKCQDVNRTHAYAVQNGDGLLSLYKWLNGATEWVDRCHIDHHYGRMHRKSESGYYAPAEWLCGQADGLSDISFKTVDTRWWERRVSAKVSGGKFVAVVGLHRSGSSCVATMLSILGVNMGDKLGGYEPTGGGEAQGLAALCERAARFPKAKIENAGQVQRNLRNWIQGRLAKTQKSGQLAGGKYPHLCAMGDMLKEICGDDLLVIHCNRPLEESIESLRQRSRKVSGWLAASDEQCEAVQRWLHSEKQRFLGSMPASTVLHIDYERLLCDPPSVVEDIIRFLSISPSRTQVDAAVAHVSPQQRSVAL